VNFTGGDATSGVESCDAPKTYAGPDNANASVAGDCHDKAGNTGTGSLSLKYDATAPVSTATPDRQPNANGWYRTPVTVTFGGTDATSGLDSCDTAKTYSGPDMQSHTLSGACLDKAGNSSSASRTLKYDATAPVSTATPDRQPNVNGWYRAPVTVAFAGTDATSDIDSCDQAKTYSGPDSQSTTLSRTLKYDATAPQSTATASRQPNAKRLVQGLGHRDLRGHRRHVGHRFLRSGAELRRAGHTVDDAEWRMPGQGWQRRRERRSSSSAPGSTTAAATG
jgi:hypothetical protein